MKLVYGIGQKEYLPEEEMLDGHIWELSLTSSTEDQKKFGVRRLIQQVLTN